MWIFLRLLVLVSWVSLVVITIKKRVHYLYVLYIAVVTPIYVVSLTIFNRIAIQRENYLIMICAVLVLTFLYICAYLFIKGELIEPQEKLNEESNEDSLKHLNH